MKLIEEFTSIVENEKEVIPFLKKLDKDQKKEIQPILKKLQKYYAQYIQKEGTSSYSTRGTQNQYRILSISAFICFNQKDFEQSVSYGVFNRENLTPILQWYCPDWFKAYVDKLAFQEFIFFDYEWYMDLVEQGYLNTNKQIVAKILPAFIFPRKEKTWKYEYRPENLLKREITLKEHIWYLFEFESNIHFSDNYMQFEDDSSPRRWMDTLKGFMNEGKIDRERLLKESISSVTRNFNQSASNWFMDLFIFLEPTPPELLYFQSELINTFNSTNSKPYNAVLKLFKNLALEPNFAILSFLDHVPLVLTAESKTATSSALMVLDKLAKKNIDHREQICIASCQAFIHQDNNLQIRAAKLIQKYGDKSSESLKENIQTYYESLFFEARNALIDFLIDLPDHHNDLESNLLDVDSNFCEIKIPETFDEFVFLASQSFDQNESYHFDLLPAAILKFQHEMTPSNIPKLMPAFQRAYKMITSDWTSSMGYLDNMLATFFISFGQLLMNFDPISAEPIREMHESFIKLENDKKAKWDGYKNTLGGIKQWDIYTHSSGYKPYKNILLNAFSLLERKIDLPLLSTPTKEPCWVSSIALIERLSCYQKANINPGDMDFQVAISRCFSENKYEAIKLANENLKGEYREIIGLALGEDHHPNDSSRLKSAWLVAGVTRSSPNIGDKWHLFSNLSQSYLNGEFNWVSLVEDYVWQQYDYKSRKNINVTAKRKIIRINFGEKQQKASSFKTVLNKVFRNYKEIEPSIYDHIELKYEYISAEHNDIKRLLYLNPFQPHILLAHIINKGLRFIDFSGENDKKLIINTLETLLILNFRHGVMSHLFIASCLISSDKTVRSYAAELWIKGVTEGSLDSALIGEIIGKHEYIELAPLKRFTDLAISNMFQISKNHNRSLEDLLINVIVQMNEKPINGCKKLLEIYAEVMSINKSKVMNNDVISRLNSWKNSESLKKAIEKLTS